MRTGQPFPRILKRVLKILGIGAAVVTILFGLASWILFHQRNELLLNELETFMRKSQSGSFEVGSLDLRPFRNFPDITIELDSITYWEHKDSVRQATELPILHVQKLDVSLDFWSLVTGQVKVSEISLNDGHLHLVEYKGGILNLDRALAKPSKATAGKPIVKQKVPRKPTTPAPTKAKPAEISKPASGLKIELEKIELNNVRLSWKSYHDLQLDSFLVKSLAVDIQNQPTVVKATLSSRFAIESVRFNQARLPSSELSVDANISYEAAHSRLVIEKTSITYDIFSASASGIYEHLNNRTLDLSIDASSNDLPLLSRLFQQKAMQQNKEVVKSGDIFLKGRVFGQLKKQMPQFDLTFGVSHLSFHLPRNLGSFRDLGFQGHFTSGAAANYSTATLDIRNLKGQVPGGSIEGNLYLANLVKPYLRCQLNANFQVDGYDEVFLINRVEKLRGAVKMKARYDGPLQLVGFKANETRPAFDISFAARGLSFQVPNHPSEYSDIGFEGNFVSGSSPDLSNAKLEIRNLKGIVPGGNVHGEFQLSNLAHPYLSYRLGARVRLEGLEELFSITWMKDLRGSATANAQFDGPLDLLGTHAMDSSRSSKLTLDSVSFVVAPTNHRVVNLQATLENKNNRAAVKLGFHYGQNDLQVNATLDNLMHRLFNEERIVEAQGHLRSGQLFTRDLIFDTARSASVDDRVTNLSFDFSVTNDSKKVDGRQLANQFGFSVRNLSATLDQLPDIRKFNTSGRLALTEPGPILTLNDLQLVLPQGSLSVAGKLQVPKKRQVQFDGKITARQLPWIYVQEISDEISGNLEPSRKNLPVKEMDLLTAELDLSTSLQTYPFDFHRLELRTSKGSFRLSNGKSFSTQRLSGTLEPFRFLHPINSGAVTGIGTIAGQLKMEKLQVPGLVDLNLDMTLHGRNDTLTVDFKSVSRKALSEDGVFVINLGGKVPTYQARYVVKETPAEDLIQKFHKGKLMEGKIDYVIDLQTAGKTWSDLRDNLNGSLDVSGDSLDIYGVNIDDVLTKFQKSQKFNLTDLGAVVVAGPIGIVATKGSDFVALAAVDLHSDQRSRVQKLLTRWQLKNRILTTQDVAFATAKNRIAIDGSIDFAHDSIPSIRVAVIDPNGCSLMDQRLYGKFSNLQHGKLNITKTLLGSVINFVNAVVGADCTPIYRGQVKHPGKE